MHERGAIAVWLLGDFPGGGHSRTQGFGAGLDLCIILATVRETLRFVGTFVGTSSLRVEQIQHPCGL